MAERKTSKKVLSAEDLQFLKGRQADREQVAVGYCGNLQERDARRYEKIYKTYMDQRFALTIWCDDCVFNMLKRLFGFFADQLDAPDAPEKETPPEVEK